MSASKVIRDVIIWDADRTDAVLGDIVITDGMISEITSPGSAKCEVQFDGHGECIAIPGLINSHTHTPMTLLRCLGEGLPLMEWLEQKIYPIEAKLTEDHVKIGTELALLEMISTGTTAFADMYFLYNTAAVSMIDSGIKAAISRSIVTDDGRRIKEALELAARYNGRDGLMSVQLAPHAPYSCKIDDIAQIVNEASQRGLTVHLHWLEAESELEMFRSDFKLSPTEYLRKIGIDKAAHIHLAHGVWHPIDELDVLASSNVTIVHNPKSNIKLASGITPIKKMLDHGVNVALGTDGASSNNRLDMWDEIRFASLIHKVIDKDAANSVSARDALRMATAAGAACGLFGKCGYMREGYSADIAVIDASGPNYVGLELDCVPEYLAYSGSSRDVAATIVAGRTLYERGKFTTLDAPGIIKRARQARKELTQN